jgi:hypothetical protein
MDIMKMLKQMIKEMMSFLKKINNMKLKEKVILVGLFALFYVVVNVLLKQSRLTERFSPFSANKTMGPVDALPQHKPKEQSGGKMKLVMYSMSTCGHCKQSKPEFKKLMGKKLPNCDCEVKEDAQNDPEWKKIQGFPTFKMHKSNGEVEVYGEDKSKCLNGQCKRDALSLEHFVSECGKA